MQALLQLGPGDELPETDVGAASERDVPARVTPQRIEALWIVKYHRVPISERRSKNNDVASPELNPS